MALNKQSVHQAKKILKLINTKASTVEFEVFDRHKKYDDLDYIYLVDKKSDDGFESVFMNVENIGTVQQELWNQYKRTIPNTFIEDIEGDITRIGWF